MSFQYLNIMGQYALLNNSIKIIIQQLVYHSISMTFFISIN